MKNLEKSHQSAFELLREGFGEKRRDLGVEEYDNFRRFFDLYLRALPLQVVTNDPSLRELRIGDDIKLPKIEGDESFKDAHDDVKVEGFIVPFKMLCVKRKLRPVEMLVEAYNASEFPTEEYIPEKTLYRCAPLLEQNVFDDLIKLKSAQQRAIAALDGNFLINSTMRILGSAYYLSRPKQATDAFRGGTEAQMGSRSNDPAVQCQLHEPNFESQ